MYTYIYGTDDIQWLSTPCTTVLHTNNYSHHKSSHVTSSDKQYWAKGTGFGTGSTASAWNMEAMIAEKKSEEKYINLCFAILAEFLQGGEEEEESSEGVPCGSDGDWEELVELLSSSCLLPTMASYLVNDSGERREEGGGGKVGLERKGEDVCVCD